MKNEERTSYGRHHSTLKRRAPTPCPKYYSNLGKRDGDGDGEVCIDGVREKNKRDSRERSI